MNRTMTEHQIRHWERHQDRYRTSHILHLILSILTAGIWMFCWALVALSNANERQKAQLKINKLIKELSDDDQ